MINIAVLGYGTVGSGVVEVIRTNHELINKRAGEEIKIKYVLDLRDFPGDPVEEVLVHDFEQIVNDFDHAFNSHGLFCHNKTAIWISGCKFGLERWARHLIVGVTVFDALLFIHVKDCWQKGIIFAQNECMVKVF